MSPITELVGGAKAYGWGNLSTSATAFESIATYTSTGSSGDIVFSSIPSNYSHLQIRGILRTNDTGSFNNQALRFNGDTASNYALHRLRGDGTNGAANATVNIGSINDFMRAPGTGVSSNIFAAAIIDILDYANTNKFKTIRVFNGVDDNGSGQIILTSGLWRNTNAITTITITPSGGTAITGSTLALYGIKAAA